VFLGLRPSADALSLGIGWDEMGLTGMNIGVGEGWAPDRRYRLDRKTLRPKMTRRTTKLEAEKRKDRRAIGISFAGENACGPQDL
jgi:hypothetical protein